MLIPTDKKYDVAEPRSHLPNDSMIMSEYEYEAVRVEVPLLTAFMLGDYNHSFAIISDVGEGVQGGLSSLLQIMRDFRGLSLPSSNIF